MQILFRTDLLESFFICNCVVSGQLASRNNQNFGMKPQQILQDLVFHIYLYLEIYASYFSSVCIMVLYVCELLSLRLVEVNESSVFPPGNGPPVGGATGQLVVRATHAYTGQQPGDLSFVPGDSITVLTRTDTQNDWWEGQLADGSVGIFPANFVTF